MSKGLCPSSRAREGALLIGVVVGDKVTFIQPAPTVTDEDLRQAGGGLEARFKFSFPCLHGACHNYGEGRCDLIHKLVTQQAQAHPLPDGSSEGLWHAEDCPIRSECQWFRDAGIRACGICPSVLHPRAVEPLPE